MADCYWKMNGNKTHAWDDRRLLGRTYGGAVYHLVCTGSVWKEYAHALCGRSSLELIVRKSVLGDDVQQCDRCVKVLHG